MIREAATPGWQRSAVRLAADYRRGVASPVDILQSCFARIDAIDPLLNAFVAQRRDAALSDAKLSAARFAAGRPLSAIDGIPLAVKDNIPSADLPTTWGCTSLKDWRPDRDELALARARAGGALIVGKTNVPEFTLDGYTSNRLFGTTRNPWNTDLTPGGSSGGSVAAVASGMVPLALGTDGGGSTRRPASHTGLIGFKPSSGAIARRNALPQLLLDFEVIGVFGRTVADARLLFDAIRGPDPSDRLSLAVGRVAPLLHRPLRVRYVPTFGGAPVDPHIVSSCRRAADRLSALGHEVSEGALGLDLAWMDEDWPVVAQVGLAALFAAWPEAGAQASERFVSLAAAGARLPAPTLWRILDRVVRLRRDAVDVFECVDVVLTPAAAALPWPADEAYPPTIAGRPVGPRGHAVYTPWVNAAGLPAVAVPCEPSPAGLPIGVQLVAGYGADDQLLTLAAAFEQAEPAGWRWPAL